MFVVQTLNRAARRVPVWLVYLLGIVPAGLFLMAGITGASGPEPIKALEHDLGEFALQLLILGLAVTPLRRFIGLNLIKFRRAIGLLA
ncbi:MAG: sulfoxide reductase heme-binding subunit YedZ, partial [Paracoccaceae bacterium]